MTKKTQTPSTPDLVAAILARLEHLGKRRVWLADLAAARGVASRRMTLHHLAGTHPLSWQTACGLAALVGLHVRLTQETCENSTAAPPPADNS